MNVIQGVVIRVIDSALYSKAATPPARVTVTVKNKMK